MKKSIDLKDKWVMVTGASSGLGKQMCIDLAEHYGAKIFAVARRKERLEELANLLAKTTEVEIATLDVTDSYNVTEVFASFTYKYQLDAVILNAGISYYETDALLTLDQKHKMIATNISGTVHLSHIAINYFHEQKKFGALLFITSVAARVPVAGQALYSGTKGFAYNYIKALQWENRKKNISMSICLPGGIKTEMISDKDKKDLEQWLMDVDVASRKVLKGFSKGKQVYALSFSDMLSIKLAQFVPSALLNRFMNRIYNNDY